MSSKEENHGLTQQLLHEYFEYKEGELFWKISNNGRISIGQRAGSSGKEGRGEIQIHKKLYGIHRIVWIMFNGTYPKIIDHINGDPSDNRIGNLREATNGQNMFNSKIAKNNKSGVKGVHFDKHLNKWRAMITVNDKMIDLGCYSDLEEARKVITKARNELHGEFARHE